MGSVNESLTTQKLIHCRMEGRCSSREFIRNITRKRSRKSLLFSPKIISPDRHITSLDVHPVDTRYLLSGSRDGTVSIYDLSRWGSQNYMEQKQQIDGARVHQPIGRSTRAATAAGQLPSGHAQCILNACWYPIDSGAFVTCSTDGNVLVWDTNEMVPVSRLAPFEYDSIPEGPEAVPTCMELSPWNGRYAAAGSRTVNAIKLLDIRTGAASHSLVGHRKGISVVRWSPACEHILASGGYDGCIRLWDIRKAGSRGCITVLDRDLHSDETLSTRYKPTCSHLRPKAGLKAKKLHAPNDYRRAERKATISHEGYISGASFSPSGHSLLSTGSDGVMSLWDLRSTGQLVPRRFTSPNGGRPVEKTDSSHRYTPIHMTWEDPTTVWIKNGSRLFGFSLHDGGTPRQILKGHLHGIDTITSVPSSGELISGGKDGLILMWGQPSEHTITRKRRLQQDQDTW